jgi:hypothetical protein
MRKDPVLKFSDITGTLRRNVNRGVRRGNRQSLRQSEIPSVHHDGEGETCRLTHIHVYTEEGASSFA